MLQKEWGGGGGYLEPEIAEKPTYYFATLYSSRQLLTQLLSKSKLCGVLDILSAIGLIEFWPF